MKFLHFLVITSLGCGVFNALAEEEAPKDDSPLDLSTVQDSDYALPVPGEILASLNAAKPETWKSVAEAAGAPAGSIDDEASSAVLLGAAVADCFLAIESQDASLFENRSKSVLEAARKLGAEQPLLDSGAALVKTAADGEWDKILPQLDRLHLDTIDAMRKIGDDDAEAITLASGWLRGLRLYTEALLADYSADATKALRQRDLAKHLTAKLDGISDSAKENESVKKLSAALAKLPAALPEGEEDTLTQEQVKALNEIAK